MDLDGFKIVNDRHGHPAGDRLLVAFARLAHDYLPPTSLVCRVGGEEFAAVLPGADPERAHAVADEIRALFAHVVLDGPAGPRPRHRERRRRRHAGRTLCPTSEIIELLGRADICLYAAKRSGRDRVVAEGDPALADPALAEVWRRSRRLTGRARASQPVAEARRRGDRRRGGEAREVGHGPAQRPGRRRRPPRARPRRRARSASPPRGPTICRPKGRPASSRPSGRLSAGWPASVTA